MAKSGDCTYAGDELDLFALATNWKAYVRREIAPYLMGNVLEVGAGIGGTTVALNNGSSRLWVCLEPDARQAKRLQNLLAENRDTPNSVIVVGFLAAFAERQLFDCILYVDVLEHIQKDGRQIEMAAKLVRPGGHIIVLSPAHQWLFSEFDRTIGHLRRYDKRSLRMLMPTGWAERKLTYLDSMGVLLSLGNALALRQPLPTRPQILIWDRFCVPISRVFDRICLGYFGKSLLGVWQKPASA